MPDRVKLSFVIFDIRALWRSGLSARVYGNSGRQKVNDGDYKPVQLLRSDTSCWDINRAAGSRQWSKRSDSGPSMTDVAGVPWCSRPARPWWVVPAAAAAAEIASRFCLQAVKLWTAAATGSSQYRSGVDPWGATVGQHPPCCPRIDPDG